MKNLFIIILFILFSGCSLQKKSVKTNSETSSKTEFNQSAENKSSGIIQNDKEVDLTQNIQNDKKSDLKITTTTTEYYPPDPGSGKDKGAIKSETTSTTEHQETDKGKLENKKKEVDKGRTEENQNSKIDTNKKSNETALNKSEENTEPAPDPHRWMWIFFILALIAAGIIYLKRSKVFDWAKSVLSKIGIFRKI